MANNIVQEQNKPKQIERLAAQSYLYSTAKRAVIIQTSLDIVSPVVFAILAANFPNFVVYTALGTGIITVLDQILERYQSSHKKQAADIQETFDCDVVEIECRDLAKKNLPDLEEIVEAAENYKRRNNGYTKLVNWYPKIVEQLPLYLARLVCQRENCWWDSQLRRRYKRWVQGILLLLCLIVAVIGLADGFSFGKLVFVIVIPLLPAFVWAVRESAGQNEAADAKDGLKSFSEELWEKALKKELSVKEVEEKSRHLQDHIYNNRRANPFILDFFYNRLRSMNEFQMKIKADESVDEALVMLKNTNTP